MTVHYAKFTIDVRNAMCEVSNSDPIIVGSGALSNLTPCIK